MLTIHPKLKDFVRPSDHSTYSPSSMDRLIACPASIKECKDIPEGPAQEFSVEGTLAHAYAEARFYEDMLGAEMTETMVEIDIVGTNDKKTVNLIQECSIRKSFGDMCTGADMYVKSVRDWLGNPEVGNVMWYGLERGVPIFPEEGAFGTGDCIIIGSRSAVIIDYKFGKKKVYANTPQLKAYAAGVLRYLQDVPEDYRIYTVIVQPRVDVEPSVHCYTVEEIREFLLVIKDMIDTSKDPNGVPYRGDKKHCFWCPASRTSDPRFKCSAIKRETSMVAEEDLRGYLRVLQEPVDSMTAANPERDEALKKLIALAPAVSQAAQKAKEEFEFRILEGEVIPGVQFTSTEGNRKWANDDETTWSLLATRFPKFQDKLTKSIPATVKLKTLGEVEKLVGKDALNGLTVKPISKVIELSDSELSKHTNLFIDYQSTDEQPE